VTQTQLKGYIERDIYASIPYDVLSMSADDELSLLKEMK
jgi:hypothetical protein